MNVQLVDGKEINMNPQDTVLEYYSCALITGRCSVNFYYEPHREAQKQLMNKGVLKEITYRGIFLGHEYKNHLFRVVAGSGDCEEILVKEGKLSEGINTRVLLNLIRERCPIMLVEDMVEFCEAIKKLI